MADEHESESTSFHEDMLIDYQIPTNTGMSGIQSSSIHQRHLTKNSEKSLSHVLTFLKQLSFVVYQQNIVDNTINSQELDITNYSEITDTGMLEVTNRFLPLQLNEATSLIGSSISAIVKH